MVTSIRSIDTEFDGYLFRSRTEARWAHFYKSLGIPYDYEPQGYEMDGVRYLPDFWMPSLDAWIEIKGAEPTEAEFRKAQLLGDGTKKKVYVFSGNLDVPAIPFETESAWMYYPDPDDDGGGWDSHYLWCECPSCGSFGIEFDGRADRLGCKRTGCLGCPPRGDRGHNYDSVRLVRAYRAAKQARFEFLPKNMRRVVEEAGMPV